MAPDRVLKTCEHCGGEIPYGPDEGPKNYARRRFCTRACGFAYRRANAVPLSARLWAKIAVAGPDECWLWQAATTPNGYGVIGRGSQVEGNVLAHVAVYLERVGPIPEGYQVDHQCRVTRCCNPAHLAAVTQLENLRRQAAAAEEGRASCGSGRHRWPENAKRSPSGKQYCRECKREYNRTQYLARRRRGSA